MDKLTTLFHAIGDLFTGSSWFQYIQWPFWTFLFLIAIGGVYTARFQKNTLFCRSIQGTLKLALIYMAAVACYVWIPSYMATVSQLPFLSVSGKNLTLVNPLGLIDRWSYELPRVLVRLYFLLFTINAVSIVDYSGKNPLVWLVLQIVVCTGALVVYEAVSLLINELWIFPDYLLHNTVAILLLLTAFLMLALKLFFLITRKSGNHTYTVVYQFFTTQRLGSLFTTSFLSLLVVLAFLVTVSLFGNSRMDLANFNPTAFFLIAFMCMITLSIYNMLFTERKP